MAEQGKPPGSKSAGMKSAYELALERLEQDGIERPREEAMPAAVREQIAEVRRRTEAKLAELEILHRDKLRSPLEPGKLDEQEDLYRRERRRLESDRDAKIERLRGAAQEGNR